MPMTIKIVLDGICLSYRSGNYWRVILLCDATHQAKFKHPTTGADAMLWNRNDREVTFDPLPAGGPAMGNGFERIFNLSADYAHGKDGEGRSYLNVASSGSSPLRFVQLDIPNAAMALETETARDYWVQPKEPAGHPITIIGKVAATVSFTFVVNAATTMVATNPNQRYEIPYDEGGTKTIILNNNCGGGSCLENDFPYVYEWLTDRRDGRRFFAGQVSIARFSGGQLVTTQPRDKEIVSAEMIEARASPLYGNCDPIVNEPPPGP